MKCKKNIRKSFAAILFSAIMVLSAFSVMCTSASAATDAEIEQAIVDGLAYLASTQDPVDGSWGTGISEKPARTAIVLLKLESRATELGLDPFDNDPASPTYYEYADNVIAGMDYLLSNAYIVSPLPVQVHGPSNDDPDSNGNGQGIAFGAGFRVTYTTGLALCALGASAHPDDRSYTIGGNSYTYKQIAQDVADWLAFAQSDSGSGEGGWYYTSLDNAGNGAEDNSNSGYATLGLAYGENFGVPGVTIPPWVRTELNLWITAIQDVSGGTDDGGSWYRPITWSWVNILKTGNLIHQMKFYGDDQSDPRVQDAIDYLGRHWRDLNNDPGWGYSLPVSAYQAMFTTMKGLESMEVDLIDTDGDSVSDNDWYNQEPSAAPPEDFATVLVSQQITVHGDINGDLIDDYGSWPQTLWDYEDNRILSTTWALLTLEKIAPPPPSIEGRMTGGGSVFTDDGMRVTHGFTLHCNVSKEPNNLQVNWGKGNKFHLESLDQASCSDDPTIDEAPPVAGFDTYKGEGTGRYNGVSGAKAKWIFTDAGEPGKNNDYAEITITDVNNNVVLTVSGYLNSGNQQAHED